jgi:hypothetical protein
VDPAVYFDADPDPASQNYTDPDPQQCYRYLTSRNSPEMYVNRTHYPFSEGHSGIDTHKFDFSLRKCRKNAFRKKTIGDSNQIKDT